MSKKQTAVDYLIEHLTQTYHLTDETLQEFKLAKEMERTQIENARLDPLKMMHMLHHKHGYFGGHDNIGVIEREIRLNAEYYNQTYGK